MRFDLFNGYLQSDPVKQSCPTLQLSTLSPGFFSVSSPPPPDRGPRAFVISPKPDDIPPIGPSKDVIEEIMLLSSSSYVYIGDELFDAAPPSIAAQ